MPSVKFQIFATVASILFIGTATATAQSVGFLHNGVTAHRGDSLAYPENTMPAFRSALEVGADWIELDIFATRDGQLVVIHDATTKRVGDRNVRVADVDYAELKAIDVAYRFREAKGLTLSECPRESAPLLSEVLALVKGQTASRVSIQPKADVVAEAIALVRAMDMAKWVGFNDGSLPKMSQVKKLAPDIRVFWDRGTNIDVMQDIAIAKKHGFESMVVHFQGITEDVVKQLRAAGFEVGAWTVNDPNEMERLLKLGVERIYTDDPATLLSLKG